MRRKWRQIIRMNSVDLIGEFERHHLLGKALLNKVSFVGALLSHQ